MMLPADRTFLTVPERSRAGRQPLPSLEISSPEYQSYLKMLYYSPLEQIKRQSLQTVDKLHYGAQVEVRNGIETLSRDIRGWDTKLFEADNFELALHKKAQRDEEEFRRKESLAKALGQNRTISRV